MYRLFFSILGHCFKNDNFFFWFSDEGSNKQTNKTKTRKPQYWHRCLRKKNSWFCFTVSCVADVQVYRHKDKRDRRDDRDNHQTDNIPTSWVAFFLKEKLTAFSPTYPILPPDGVATPSPSRTAPDGDTVRIRTLHKVGFKQILWLMKITHNETLKTQ